MMNILKYVFCHDQYERDLHDRKIAGLPEESETTDDLKEEREAFQYQLGKTHHNLDKFIDELKKSNYG